MIHTRTRHQQGSLTIEARKNGPDVWVFRWRESTSDGPVKRKAVLGNVKELTKTQAQRKADVIRRRANSGESNIGNASVLTVQELAMHYSKHELCDSSEKKPKVRKAYEYILRTYVLPKWANSPVVTVKAVAVEDWLKSINRANSSKAKIREVFGAVFRHGMRYELCAANPIALVRQVRKRRAEAAILEPEEIAAILKQLDGVEPARTSFLLAAVTGLRRGEVFGLQWQDVDEQRAILHVRRSVVDGEVGDTKTESSRRPVPLSPLVAEALAAWKARAIFTGPNDWLFASEVSFGKLPLWPATLWKRHIVPAIQRAGICKPLLGWHTLRRSYASVLLSSGVSLRTSMELMRHATAEMTLATYAQSVGTEKRDAGARVAEMLLGASGPLTAPQRLEPLNGPTL